MALFSSEERSKVQLVSRESGILCGRDCLNIFLKEILSEGDHINWKIQDGESFGPGDVLLEWEGKLLTILRLERPVLNLIQYLSGIASETNKIVKEFPQIRILDTRKTVPAYRKLAKYAVYTGGGWNHRIDLSDMAMIKDNHVARAGSMHLAVQKIRTKFPQKKVELEIDRLDQLKEAISSSPDIILLDNFNIEDTKTAVETIRSISPDIWIECSGGITPSKLKSLNELGEIGVSMGYLTHTTRFCDLSIEVIS